MKKVFALFSLAAVCCMTGCSNVTQIFENDERLCNQTETGYEERYFFLDAKTEVYNGEYGSFDISAELDIGDIIAPIGDDSFVVSKDDGYFTGVSVPSSLGEYGIYTLGGGYKTLFPKHSTDGSQNMLSVILCCSDEYILYYKAALNDYGSIAATELGDLYLLKLGDMTEKRIYRTMQPYNARAVICDNAVYLTREEAEDRSAGGLKGTYSNSAVVKYDIETGGLEDLCLNAGSPVKYKNKPAFYVGGGNFVSYAEPLFDPAEYGLTAQSLQLYPSEEMAYSFYGSADGVEDLTMAGYIKDGERFDIFRVNDLANIYDISFADGCAVWSGNFFGGEDRMLPMFYSDKRGSVIVIEDERGDYTSFIHGGKIYFFGTNENGYYSRALVLDIKNIK